MRTSNEELSVKAFECFSRASDVARQCFADDQHYEVLCESVGGET